MKTIPITKVEQPQMKPLKIKPQNKSMEEEVKFIESDVGAQP
jgi:hypothetical protein